MEEDLRTLYQFADTGEGMTPVRLVSSIYYMHPSLTCDCWIGALNHRNSIWLHTPRYHMQLLRPQLL